MQRFLQSLGTRDTGPASPFGGRYVFADTMEMDGRDRTAIVVLPSGYDHETRIPVLFGYYGGGGSARQMREQTDLDPIADESGLAVVYLGAYDGFWVTPCPDCDNEGRDPLEEIEYAEDLIRSLSRSHALDPDRAYTTGFSMGGSFLKFIACHPDAPFAGIAPVAAGARRSLPGWCATFLFIRHPAPVRITNGMGDRSVPPEGGETWPGVDELVAWWREWNGCTASSTSDVHPETTREFDPQVVPERMGRVPERVESPGAEGRADRPLEARLGKPVARTDPSAVPGNRVAKPCSVRVPSSCGATAIDQFCPPSIERAIRTS